MLKFKLEKGSRKEVKEKVMERTLAFFVYSYVTYVKVTKSGYCLNLPFRYCFTPRDFLCF